MMDLKDKKKYALLLLGVLVLVFTGFFLMSNGPCCPAASAVNIEIDYNISDSDVTVELYHFHGINQCYSCIKLGELAEKTVDTYFKEELDSGQLVFGHINYDLPENKGIKDRFKVTGSSLWIGTTIDGVFNKEQNTNVWYKIEDESDYLSYLKGILDKRLSGDLS